MSFVLTDIENATRLDLFDPAGSSQRWSQADIDRAIDKAIERYSTVYPNIVYGDMPSQPYQRTYAYPSSWNATYPVLWLERIVYPLQVYGSYFSPPASAPGAARVAGTTLGIGTYQYLSTFISQGGETPAGPAVSVTTTGGNQAVTLSNIPLGPTSTQLPGIVSNSIIGRNIYRTQVGGSTFSLLATIPDNTTTAYSDIASDASIASKPNPPTLNTSGVMYYPPVERNFAEYSNLYDSSAAMAAGGNLGNQGAVGTASSLTGTGEPSFTLMISDNQLPQDNTSIMRVFYATKHQLDNSGSTIPEIHRDVIVLGATAYCLEAYQLPTNDNFDFQDGGLRDRIDDTAIPKSWAAAARNKMTQFTARLEEIKQQRDYASSARAHWGEIPRWWGRL